MRPQLVGLTGAGGRARALQDQLPSSPPRCGPHPVHAGPGAWTWDPRPRGRQVLGARPLWLNSVKLGESRRLTAAPFRNTLGARRAGRGGLGPPPRPAEDGDGAAVLPPAGPGAPPPLGRRDSRNLEDRVDAPLQRRWLWDRL